jgi:hypothetical protein
MLTHLTLDRLKALKLDGMTDAFVELQNQARAAELAHAEWGSLDLLNQHARLPHHGAQLPAFLDGFARK